MLPLLLLLLGCISAYMEHHLPRGISTPTSQPSWPRLPICYNIMPLSHVHMPFNHHPVLRYCCSQIHAGFTALVADSLYVYVASTYTPRDSTIRHIVESTCAVSVSPSDTPRIPAPRWPNHDGEHGGDRFWTRQQTAGCAHS